MEITVELEVSTVVKALTELDSENLANELYNMTSADQDRAIASKLVYEGVIEPDDFDAEQCADTHGSDLLNYISSDEIAEHITQEEYIDDLLEHIGRETVAQWLLGNDTERAA